MNLDCNLLTAEAKQASETASYAGGSTKQTTCRHSSNDIVHLMFIENCQINSK